MEIASIVFSDLVLECPEDIEARIYQGMTQQALGQFEEAVKVLESLYPLDTYRPFYYTSYGDCLRQTGRLKQSRDVFYKDVEYFKETGIIFSSEMLDGAFQNLLYLDIVLGNGKYPEDIKLYYTFLEQVEMTEAMQTDLAGNIVYFSSLMSNKWYRPLFLEFITYIRDKKFLTKEAPLKSLRSAFVFHESFIYHEDKQITALTEAYLCASQERTYIKQTKFLKEEIDKIDALALTYDWYMCQYAPEHPEEIEHIKNTYPYSYADNKPFFEQIEANAEQTAEKILEELYLYAERYSKEITKKEFGKSMHHAYTMACKDKKEPAYVYDGINPYKRMQPKIGRNDPCPCGSGKNTKNAAEDKISHY